MAHERIDSPVLRVPGSGKEHGAAAVVKLRVDRVEAVDHELQLRREAEVVERRSENDEVAFKKMRIELEHVVAVDAGRGAETAPIAAAAGRDPPEGGVEAEDLSPLLPHAENEFVGKQKGRAATVRTSRDDGYPLSAGSGECRKGSRTHKTCGRGGRTGSKRIPARKMNDIRHLGSPEE